MSDKIAEENHVIWKIEYCAPPAVLRYCKKCGKKEEYLCSGEFRVNAQQKNLDIWLIYKCNHCNTTWNSAIYSRVSPQKLGADLLERFYKNDESWQYSMRWIFHCYIEMAWKRKCQSIRLLGRMFRWRRLLI